MIYKKAKLTLLLLIMIWCIPVRAQHVAINNNLLFDVAGTFSAGVEIPLMNSTSLDLYGSIRPWKRGNESVNKHWTIQAQYRLWPCQVMNGFFWGPYIHGGQFNIGNETLPFGLLRGLKPNRYEGFFLGGGMGIGYEYALAKHWNVGGEIGAGYTFIDYKKYACEKCGPLRDKGNYNYIGISRLGLSIIYVF
jgi:hypothetical protein